MINSWREAFSKYKIFCGQILLTHYDTETRRSSINARNTIEALIKLNSSPSSMKMILQLLKSLDMEIMIN